MTKFRADSKGVQTDLHISHARLKLLKKLQTYITAVSQYRLHLFNQYTQSDVYCGEQNKYQDLINVRKEILNRFAWVMNELEQTIENLQTRRLPLADAHQSIDRPLVREVIEASLNVDLSSINDQKRQMPSVDEWKMYRRDLFETKEDLCVLNLLVHRGISKIDRLVNTTNLYI